MKGWISWNKQSNNCERNVCLWFDHEMLEIFQLWISMLRVVRLTGFIKNKP